MKHIILLFSLFVVFQSCEKNDVDKENSKLQKADVIFDKTYPSFNSYFYDIKINKNDELFLIRMGSIVKMSKIGEIIWEIKRTTIDLAPTKDGGCVVVFMNYDNRTRQLAKISSEGTIDWEQSGENYELSKIIVDDNDEIFGIGDIVFNSNKKPKFFKYTKNGDYLFSKFLVDTDKRIPYHTLFMLKLSNNNIVIGTFNNVSSERENYDFNIIEFDTLANNILERNYGGYKNEYLTDLIELPDGGLILTGISESKDGDISWREELSLNHGNAWIVKLGEDREIKWNKLIGGNNGAYFAKAFYMNNNLRIAFESSSTDVDFNFPEEEKSGYAVFDLQGNMIEIKYVEASMIWSGTASASFDSQGHLIILSAIHDNYYEKDTPRIIKIK